MTDKKKVKHIKLTSHPGLPGAEVLKPIQWGASTAQQRGPIIASVTNSSHRNAIGTHSGSYTVYRALAVAAGALNADHRPDLTNTMPAEPMAPKPQWKDPEKIVSIDPWGADIATAFASELKEGYDIRPTIAVTKAHINMPELQAAIAAGRLKADGKILAANGDCVVTKAAIEPVWWLPGIAKRFGTGGGMYHTKHD
jgi:hypothetical protein